MPRNAEKQLDPRIYLIEERTYKHREKEKGASGREKKTDVTVSANQPPPVLAALL